MSQTWRVHSFQGTAEQYIIYLESLVLNSTNISHSPHPSRSPGLARSPPPPPPSPPSSPSLPPSDVRNEVINTSDGDESDEVSIDTLTFIQYAPSSVIPKKRQRGKRRWEKEMDKLASGFTAAGIFSRRTEIGLSSETGVIKALDIMIYGEPQTTLVANEAAPSLVAAPHCLPDDFSRLMDKFDKATAALGVEKKFIKQMYHFRRFLSVSICCVALHNGTDLRLVNQIMKTQVSDSSEKNLARLRNGALWVNRMMSNLAGVGEVDEGDAGDEGDKSDEGGLGHLAYELFVLWGGGLSLYGEFSEAGDDGIAYFKKTISKHMPELEMGSLLPFWVPFIIKLIVGNLYTLESVCDSLNYSSDAKIQYFPRYLECYCSRRVQLPLPLPLTRKRQLQDPGSTPKSKRLRRNATTQEVSRGQAFNGRGVVNAELSPSGSLDAISCLLEEAEHIQTAGQQLPLIRSSTPVDQTLRSSTVDLMSSGRQGYTADLQSPTTLRNNLELRVQDEGSPVEAPQLHANRTDSHFVATDKDNGPKPRQDVRNESESCDLAQMNTTQQISHPPGVGNNTLALQVPTESRIVNQETLSAGNNLPTFDYDTAYDLATIAFNYNAAYDLTSIAFDYNAACDLTTIAFDYNAACDPTSISFSDDTSYNLPTFGGPPPTCEDLPMPGPDESI